MAKFKDSKINCTEHFSTRKWQRHLCNILPENDCLWLLYFPGVIARNGEQWHKRTTSNPLLYLQWYLCLRKAFNTVAVLHQLPANQLFMDALSHN